MNWSQAFNVETDLPMKALHSGSLPDVADMHCDLWPPAEGFGVEEQDDGGFKLTADGRVHLGTDHHHTLQQPIRRHTLTSLSWHPDITLTSLSSHRLCDLWPYAIVSGQSFPGPAWQPVRPSAPCRPSGSSGCCPPSDAGSGPHQLDRPPASRLPDTLRWNTHRQRYYCNTLSAENSSAQTKLAVSFRGTADVLRPEANWTAATDLQISGPPHSSVTFRRHKMSLDRRQTDSVFYQILYQLLYEMYEVLNPLCREKRWDFKNKTARKCAARTGDVKD